MRWTQTLVPTLKETPAEAEITSHKLLLRAGLIRKLTGGLYTFLPLGLRALRKVEQIIREEMNRAGALELLMPALQPPDIWQQSGRYESAKDVLFKVRDRAKKEWVLGPTHEEVVTTLVAGEINSYRQMPKNFYQIQTKFRDEIRPRFGLMRAKEFIMKDAYSFDTTDEAAQISYQRMYDAYVRIFYRCGLNFRAVEADTGLIGGSSSHEFMVLADTGEETIVYSDGGSYAANVERAEVLPPTEMDASPLRPLQAVSTPGGRSVEDVTAFLKVTPQQLVKTLHYSTGKETGAILTRGDPAANAIKIRQLLGVPDLDLASATTVERVTGAPVGFAGPVGLNGARVIAD